MQESWDEYRRRMLRETEKFIEYGLAHPELTIEIPAKPVDDHGWPNQVGEWFWDVVLTSKPSKEALRWRTFFRNKPKHYHRLRKPRPESD